MNALEAIDAIYLRLKGGQLASEIKPGGVFKHQAPINSLNEDVVINILAVDNAQLQSGVAVVNLYVPNQSLRINNIESTRHTDHARLKILTAMALKELDEFWNSAEDYFFELEQHNIEEDEVGTFLSIRLKFYSINITK